MQVGCIGVKGARYRERRVSTIGSGRCVGRGIQWQRQEKETVWVRAEMIILMSLNY